MYVKAPEGIMVKVLPAQTIPLLAVITGRACTVTVVSAVLVQPLVLEPVTVYTLVEAGLTIAEPPEYV